LARDYAQRREELQALTGLQELIRHAVLAETHPDTKGRDVVESVARFYAPVKIRGRLFRAKLTVINHKAGAHNAHVLETVEMDPAVITPPSSASEKDAFRRTTGEAGDGIRHAIPGIASSGVGTSAAGEGPEARPTSGCPQRTSLGWAPNCG
jgi:hypothetical protein